MIKTTENKISQKIKWAKRFHDKYESLAPQFGYETRKDTKEFNPYSANGKLMVEVCGNLATEIAEYAREELKKEIYKILGDKLVYKRIKETIKNLK